jgi:hypothetical protein
VVPPKLTHCLFNKNFPVMQQGGKSQRHSFQVRRTVAVIPLPYNGSARIGLLGLVGVTLPLHVRPLNSEVHSASALLPCSHPAVLNDRTAWLSGNRFEAYSSSSAFLVLLLGGIL